MWFYHHPTNLELHSHSKCPVMCQSCIGDLHGFRANPNCMNPYGYFPLHETAERFSVDMIKLLFHHGASSANVRTAGDEVIEDLLSLHVAVENTCLHKYPEDNLYPNQDHQGYIYKLIHQLCLPEMVCFTSHSAEYYFCSMVKKKYLWSCHISQTIGIRIPKD